jgi:hypothetical protein
VKVAAIIDTTHNPFDDAHRVSCLRENLTSSPDGEGLETGCALSSVPRQSFTQQNWWRWLKRIYKVKEPLGRKANALPLQIVAAFVTDLLLRAFKHCGGFKGKLYEFVTTCRDMALVPLARLGSLHEVLLATARFLALPQFPPQTQT